MIENEFKIMLSEAQYNAIHELYEWDTETEQVNSYYDTADFICGKRHITVRVRSVSGKFLLQMKLPAEQVGNGAVSRIELERQLDGIPETISGDRLKALGGAELPDVSLLGTLTTFRSVKLLQGVEIDLDRSSYFGKTDHELEIEYTDQHAAEELLSEIASKIRLDTETPAIGKIRRFLSEYKKQNS